MFGHSTKLVKGCLEVQSEYYLRLPCILAPKLNGNLSKIHLKFAKKKTYNLAEVRQRAPRYALHNA